MPGTSFLCEIRVCFSIKISGEKKILYMNAGIGAFVKISADRTLENGPNLVDVRKNRHFVKTIRVYTLTNLLLLERINKTLAALAALQPANLDKPAPFGANQQDSEICTKWYTRNRVKSI